MDIVSTFEKGMVQDPVDKPESTFLMSSGFTLISDTTNTYSLEIKKGTKLSFEITPNYTPISWCKSHNRIIIVSAYNGDLAMKNGEFGYVTIDRLNGYIGTYTPIYNHQLLNFDIQHQIEGQIISENSLIERLYCSDFNNKPKVINYNDKRFSTYILANGVVNGSSYMVIRGSVFYNGVTYGPNNISGTVFTGTTNATFTDLTGNSLVIEYVKIETIDEQPVFKKGRINFNRIIGGTKKSGAYLYFYQLETEDGYKTVWSEGTKPINIGGLNSNGGGPISYQNFQGGYNTDTSSSGIQIIIEEIDLNYKTIRVAVVRCTDNQIVEEPAVMFEGDITGSVMFINDTSNNVLTNLLAEDINIIVSNILKWKTSAVTNNIKFIGNVVTAKQFSFNPVGVSIKNIKYDLLTDMINPITDNPEILGHTSPGANVPSGQVRARQWYKVFGVPGESITYDGSTYVNGDTFQAVYPFTNYTKAGNPTVKTILHIQRYTGKYDDYIIENDWIDHKGALSSHYLKSNFRKEKYRYGFLWFDTIGNPMYVDWIGDKTTPAMSAQATDIDPETGQQIGFDCNIGHYEGSHSSNTFMMMLRSIGVNISNIDVKPLLQQLGITIAELPKYVSGFSIVMAKRDKTVLAQGVIYPVIKNTNNGTLHPLGVNMPGFDQNFIDGEIFPSMVMLYSPDFNFNFNSLPADNQGGDRLVIEGYTRDEVTSLLPEGYLVQSNYHFFNKFYKYTRVPGPNGQAVGTEGIIQKGNIRQIECGDVVPGITAGLPFENHSESNGNWPGSIGTNRKTKHSRGMAVFLDSGYNPTFGFGENTDYTASKAIVNVIRPNANLYGGTSKSALANTKYYHANHFQPIDQDFITYLTNNNGIINDIEIFGGDAYLSVWDLARGIKDNDSPDEQVAFGIAIPIESEMNLNLRQGRHLTKNRNYGDTQILDGLNYYNPTNHENFIYNGAYSNNETGRIYLGRPINFQSIKEEPNIIRFTGIKIPGETYDAFRIYPTNNFKHVSAKFGAIVNLREKLNRLFYWQIDSCGTVPVLERTTVATKLGDPIAIGQGSIAQRYDERTQYYGNQHQWGLGEFPEGFVWFDAKRLRFLILSAGSQFEDLSVINGVMNFSRNLTGNFLQSDKPVAGIGISAGYNPQSLNVYLSFRGVKDGQDFTVVINTLQKNIHGTLPFTSGMMIDFDDTMYSISNERTPGIAPNTLYTVGSKTVTNNGIYICRLEFTSSATPVQPSADALHWLLLYSFNSVHVHNIGNINQWYNYVESAYVKFRTQNPNEIEKIFENYRFRFAEGNKNFFDDIYVSTTKTSGRDLDIVNRKLKHYDRRNENVLASIPLYRGKELQQGNFLEIMLVKHCHLDILHMQTNNEQLALISVITKFRQAF